MQTNTWLATTAAGTELRIDVWCEGSATYANWFARMAGDARVPTVASDERIAVAFAIPRQHVVLELRREHEPSKAQIVAALAALYESATDRCARCVTIEPMSDCPDCGGTGTVAKAEAAFVAARAVLDRSAAQ